jgi:hypothetical protein
MKLRQSRAAISPASTFPEVCPIQREMFLRSRKQQNCLVQLKSVNYFFNIEFCSLVACVKGIFEIYDGRCLND